MAIGLLRERGSTIDDWLRISDIVQEFRNRFEAEMKTINCRELTGLDLSTREGREKAMSTDVGQRVCIPAVALAYRTVMDLLKETE